VLGITIIVMAVPEGLPMAVTIALAYSVEKMRQLNNLVRDMSACETMGNATDICSDKTGTLTENSMTVIDIYYGDNFIPVVNNINDRMKKDADLLELCTIASINSTATPDFSKSLRDQTGNKTELAILEFSKNLGVDYGRVRQLEKIVQMVPFSSERKKMLTIFQETPTSQVLYMKGAPEIVVEHCAYYKKDGKKYAIEKQWKDNLENNILRMIGEKKARAIAVAKVEVTGYKEGEDPANYERDMTFLGVFGIMDPVRQDVPPAVAIAQKAGITVRMVTGDNTQIGAAIAKECGILRKDWTPKEDDYSVMDGKTFREKVKDLQWREEDRGNGKKVKVPYVGDMLAFQRIEPQLKVIGRCQPTDKLLLVTGLQNMGKVVAVTGDGANDAPALKKADVGLGMGKTGTDICKDASKIVLLDDNFTSIVTAVKFVSIV
jgi:Ca2+ transporting ATPase